MKTVARKSFPYAVAKALGRKRNVLVTIVEPNYAVECNGTYWDGGSKSTYCNLDLSTGRTFGCKYNDEVRELQFGAKIRNALVESGFAVFCGGISCGKPATPHLYMTQDDFDKLGLEG